MSFNTPHFVFSHQTILNNDCKVTEVIEDTVSDWLERSPCDAKSKGSNLV